MRAWTAYFIYIFDIHLFTKM